MLKVLKDREFEPDDAETLLAAFKVFFLKYLESNYFFPIIINLFIS
jgi:hypothetical protein